MSNNSNRTVVSISHENYLSLHTMKSITGTTISDQLTQALYTIRAKSKMDSVRFYLVQMKPFKLPRAKLLNIKKNVIQQLRMFHLEIDRERVKVGRESLTVDDVLLIVLKFYHELLVEDMPAMSTKAAAPLSDGEMLAHETAERMWAAHDEVVIERYKTTMGITSTAPQSFL